MGGVPPGLGLKGLRLRENYFGGAEDYAGIMIIVGLLMCPIKNCRGSFAKMNWLGSLRVYFLGFKI